MLIWMCALHCEAKPVIDYYRLRKSDRQNYFDVYRNETMACMVSGMGSRKMADAIDAASVLCTDRDSVYWINLGIAGAQTLEVGTLVLASRVRQHNVPGWIETRSSIAPAFQSRPVTSVSAEYTDYDTATLFDMEAYAFIRTASRYSSLQQCQSIKVISDNEHTPPARNKAWISQLIAGNMQTIAEYVEQLQRIHFTKNV